MPATRAVDGGPNGEVHLVAELRELSELHATGALTDQEFELAKRRLLG